MDPWEEWPWYYTKEIMYEQLVPTSWWTQTNDSHSLFLHVPGFEADEVRLRSNPGTSNDGVITVSGERKANSNKIIRFEQSYIVPNDSNIEMVSGPFKDDVFRINIPKKEAVPKNPNVASCDCGEAPIICGNGEELFEEEESNAMKKVWKQLMKNKMEILRVVIAFSVGVIVSRNYKKQGKAEATREDTKSL